MAPKVGKDAISMNDRERKRINRFVILTGYSKKKFCTDKIFIRIH